MSTWKKDFAEISKNAVRYKSKNNFIRLQLNCLNELSRLLVHNVYKVITYTSQTIRIYSLMLTTNVLILDLNLDLQ